LTSCLKAASSFVTVLRSPFSLITTLSFIALSKGKSFFHKQRLVAAAGIEPNTLGHRDSTNQAALF
jgi:hypothetical protein